MKYLTLIYYDTFARFFSAIEDAVKLRDPSADFLHMAIFPSGFLYMRCHKKQTKLLAWEINRASPTTTDVSNADLDRITKYHAVVGARHGEHYLQGLRVRAQRYVDSWAKIIGDYDPDVVVLSGDTRIAAESLQYCLDRTEHRAKRYFFEQGPNGTTIFDTQGVNANCSFREHTSSLTGKGYTPENAGKADKFKRNPLFRGAELALIVSLRALGKLPPEWDTMSLASYPKKKYLECIRRGHEKVSRDTQEILVALQVPDDANNIHHNPLNLSDAELVDMVLQATHQTKLPVRVREHPLYRRRYTSELYSTLARSNRALLSDAPLEQDLAKAAMVITVNSMTGLDAYLRKVPAILLGNAFYDHLPGIQRANSQSLATAVDRNLNTGQTLETSMKDPACVFSEMRSLHLLSGHYLDEDLSQPANQIAEVLTSSIKASTVHK